MIINSWLEENIHGQKIESTDILRNVITSYVNVGTLPEREICLSNCLVKYILCVGELSKDYPSVATPNAFIPRYNIQSTKQGKLVLIKKKLNVIRGYFKKWM